MHGRRRLRHREPRAVLPPGPIHADGSKLERRRGRRCVRTTRHAGAPLAVEDVRGPVRRHQRVFPVGIRDVRQYSRQVARVPAQSRVVTKPNHAGNPALAAVLERDDRMRLVLVRPELLEPVHVSTRRARGTLVNRVARLAAVAREHSRRRRVWEAADARVGRIAVRHVAHTVVTRPHHRQVRVRPGDVQLAQFRRGRRVPPRVDAAHQSEIIAEVEIPVVRRLVASRRRRIERAARVELLPRLAILRAVLKEHRASRRHAEHEPTREVRLLVPQSSPPSSERVSDDEHPRPMHSRAVPAGIPPELLVQLCVLRQSLDERAPSASLCGDHVVAADCGECAQLPAHRRDLRPLLPGRRVREGREGREEVGRGVVGVELASPRVVRPAGLERQGVVLLRALGDVQAVSRFLFERPRPS